MLGLLVLASCFFFSPLLGCFLLIKFGKVSSSLVLKLLCKLKVFYISKHSIDKKIEMTFILKF